MYRDTIPGLAIVVEQQPQPFQNASMSADDDDRSPAVKKQDQSLADLIDLFDLSNLPLSAVPEECQEHKEPRGFH